MKYRHIAAMVAGFALDAALGDPHGWPHPVRLVGKQIELEENALRKHVIPKLSAPDGSGPLSHEKAERLAGAALATTVAASAPIVSHALLWGCQKVHPALAFAVETVLCYQLVAARSLYDESTNVQKALEADDLQKAREAVAMIVGRDTDVLDEQGVAKAAVETVAENASDGVIAPLLFMGLGGAPAAMAYKAMNTLDSMVGYKNERYINLGRFSAKLDDVVNYVPARVAGVLMCAAAPLAGLDGKRAWNVFKRDRRNHTSPNSAHTEAACAGALGVQLGGPNVYFGKVVEKPTIGDDVRPVEPGDIRRANKLMYATAILGLGLATGAGVLGTALCGRKR